MVTGYDDHNNTAAMAGLIASPSRDGAGKEGKGMSEQLMRLCPKCSRPCHNFASISGHCQRCYPAYIKQPYYVITGHPAFEGAPSIHKLGLIQQKIRKVELSPALAGLAQLLDEVWRGVEGKQITDHIAGVIHGMINSAEPSAEERAKASRRAARIYREDYGSPRTPADRDMTVGEAWRIIQELKGKT